MKKVNNRFKQWYLLKDSQNKKSISYTMVVYSFFAVLLWFVLSITDKLFGLNIREFSGSEAAMFLGPIFAIYFGRKGQKTGEVVETTESNDDDSATKE